MTTRTPRPPGDQPVAILDQRIGPVRLRWGLFPDRLVMRRSSPLGRRSSELPLAQIDTVTTHEETPYLVLGMAAMAGALLGFLGWGAMGGSLSGAWSFLAATAAGFLLGASRWMRVSWVRVETVGGQRFYLLGSLPSRGQVGDFLRVLRQARTLVLAETHSGWRREGIEDLPEGTDSETERIDPRWIN